MTRIKDVLSSGASVVRALQSINSKYSKEERLRFIEATAKLKEAAERVLEAEQTVAEAVARCGLCDDVQDEAVRHLADVLASQGFDRFNPFKTFGMPAPSEITRQSTVTEANTVLMLASKVMALPEAKAEAKKAATSMIAAAQAMQLADTVRANAEATYTAAITQRDATLPDAWSEALTELRAAVRYGDIKEKTTNYELVFRSMVDRPKKKKVIEGEPIK